MDKIVKKVLTFSKKLKGIKYTWWTGNEKEEDDFFCVNKIPSMEELKKNGICCTSFINILRQYGGSKIPESTSKFRGGTYFWFRYFKKKNLLEKFDYTKDYPLGTLFLRNYKNINDHGHVAVYFQKYKKDNKKLLYGQIIHADAYDSCPKGSCLKGGQARTSILGYSHFYHKGGKEGYFEYAILPQNWLK